MATTTVVGWWAEAPVIVSPAPARLTITGKVPDVRVKNDLRVQPAAANLALSGQVPTVVASNHKVVSPASAGAALSPGIPLVQVGVNVAPAPAVLPLTGGAPSVVASDHKFISPGARELLIAPGVPEVVASDHKSVSPSARQLVVTGGVPGVFASDSKSASPSTRALIVAGGTPGVLVAPAQPPTFDAQGTGTKAQAQFWSYQHTATPGAYVVLVLTVDRAYTVSTMTYDGVAMTLLGSVDHNGDPNQGATKLYGLANAPGGAKTVVVAVSVSGWACSNTFSYLNVKTVSAAQTVSGQGANLAQSVAAGASQRAVQAFGKGTNGTPGPGGLSALSGGVNRYNQNTDFSSATATFSDGSGESLAFAATSAGGAAKWGGIAVLLGT